MGNNYPQAVKIRRIHSSNTSNKSFPEHFRRSVIRFRFTLCHNWRHIYRFSPFCSCKSCCKSSIWPMYIWKVYRISLKDSLLSYNFPGLPNWHRMALKKRICHFLSKVVQFEEYITLYNMKAPGKFTNSQGHFHFVICRKSFTATNQNLNDLNC